MRIECCDLLTEGMDASSDAAQRCACRLCGFGQTSLIGAPSDALAGFTRQRFGGQRLTHVGGRGDDEVVELVERGGASLHGAGAGQVQLADRLHDAGRVLRDRGAFPGEDFPSGGLGVNGIVLAPSDASVGVWAVELHDFDARGA
ncbi:hypothetical protein GCM10027610_033820 [Dactylosporangium cerinum]